MKTNRITFHSLALGTALILAPTALTAANTDTPAKGTLQVEVNIPPTWRPMFEDRVSEAFVSRVRDVFRRQGFEGEIKEVTSFDEPSPGCCLLTINLTEWRMDHIGNIDCTFTANLQTEERTRHLGVFTYTELSIMRGTGRFRLARSFEDAAEGAIRDLFRELAKTELVPGLRAS